MASPTIRVAIIGGGLAGATLANALIQIPLVEVHVYESAPEFSERGAALVLTSTAQKSFQRVTPSAGDILQRAGAVPMNSTRLVMGSGPQAGTVILDLGQSGDPGLVLHRASLLRELLAPLPKEVLHTSKKLTKISPLDKGVQISFEDGVTEKFDAVIGADGIFGSIRKHVLGPEATDEHAPSASGFWDSRNVVPYEKAKAALGEEYFEHDRQFGWIGKNAFIMHDILENRTMVQCVISAVEKDPPKNRKRTLTRESLTETLSEWLDGPIAKGMIDLILDQPDPQGYSQWEHKATPTYACGRVCIVGDAAHATSPWQGFGAGMAIEDAMILKTLFSNISSPDGVDAVFKAFDAVRRARCEAIIHSSRETGNIFCGQNEDVGVDVDKFRQSLGPRWVLIDGIDQDAHKEEAVKKLEEILST